MTHYINVCGRKGGSTRSTNTLTLAGALAARGADVLVVDLDPNGSDGGSLRWASLAQANGRHPAFTVCPALPRRVEADVVIFDHPPGTAARIPEGLGIILIPTSLDPGNLISAMRLRSLLGKRKPTPILIASRVRLDRAEPRKALAQLDGVCCVKDRAIYPTAYGSGQTIHDIKGPHAEAARMEYEPIVQQVMAAMGNPIFSAVEQGGVS